MEGTIERNVELETCQAYAGDFESTQPWIDKEVLSSPEAN